MSSGKSRVGQCSWSGGSHGERKETHKARPHRLQSMGSQRVGQDLATGQEEDKGFISV